MQGCKKLDENWSPIITYIIVQKRHNVRLFPETCGRGGGNRAAAGGRWGPDRAAGGRGGGRGPNAAVENVKPGTVVDQDIVSPFLYDFYLNSHAAIQGTNRPARYIVLVDQCGFGPDGLQLLTYWLCYLFCRCTR